MKIKLTAKETYRSKCADYVPSRKTVEGSFLSYIWEAYFPDGGGNDIDILEVRARCLCEGFAELLEILAERGVIGVADFKRIVPYQPYEEEADHQFTP